MHSPETINHILGHEALAIIQRPDMFNYSLDSVLLAGFASVTNDTHKVIEFGSGFAPVPLLLVYHHPHIHVSGLEIQPSVADIARRNVALNQMEDSIEIINEDINKAFEIYGNQSFDMVVSNPPFFKYDSKSNVSPSVYKSIARHEVSITLEDIVIQSKKVLKQKGKLVLVHRSKRLGEMMRLLHANQFGIKRMRFVHPKETQPSQMVLIEAHKASNDHIHVESPIIVHQGEGYHPRLLDMFASKGGNHATN